MLPNSPIVTKIYLKAPNGLHRLKKLLMYLSSSEWSYKVPYKATSARSRANFYTMLRAFTVQESTKEIESVHENEDGVPVLQLLMDH